MTHSASPCLKTEQDHIIVTQEHPVVEEAIKSQQKDSNKEDESEGWAVFKADGIEFQLDLQQRVERERKEKDAKNNEKKGDDGDDDAERFFIGESQPLFF